MLETESAAGWRLDGSMEFWGYVHVSDRTLGVGEKQFLYMENVLLASLEQELGSYKSITAGLKRRLCRT
ncbi:hypothetical protein SLA2020_206150 [Shorea laevis]